MSENLKPLVDGLTAAAAKSIPLSGSTAHLPHTSPANQHHLERVAENLNRESETKETTS